MTDVNRNDKPTITVGQLAEVLARLDPATPVTIQLPEAIAGTPVQVTWLNIESMSTVVDPDGETAAPSIILFAADDFDPRQF